MGEARGTLEQDLGMLSSCTVLFREKTSVPIMFCAADHSTRARHNGRASRHAAGNSSFPTSQAGIKSLETPIRFDILQTATVDAGVPHRSRLFLSIFVRLKFLFFILENEDYRKVVLGSDVPATAGNFGAQHFYRGSSVNSY